MPGLVYGPGDTSGMHTALVDLLRGRLPMTPARTAFCWAHIEDTARAHILAMERGKPGETYIIAGPRHTFEYAFDLAASIAQGSRADLPPRPAHDARHGGGDVGGRPLYETAARFHA